MKPTDDKLPDNLEELKAPILSKDEHIAILDEHIRVLKKAMFGALSTGMSEGISPR